MGLLKGIIISGFFLWVLLLTSCEVNREAEEIIDRAITAHGGEQYNRARISFDFRERHYEIILDQGRFMYESVWTDSAGNAYHDILDNEGFVRKVNDEEVELSEEDQQKYTNSLNSVVYFALLPKFLNDPAVNKKLIGEAKVKGKPYYKIKVTFDKKGGGSDHEDVFVYWIHQEAYTMDYLAYEFHVNEGGTRFREAYNVRGVNGIRFADYINYESTVEDFKLKDYDQLYEEDKVKELSRIELRNIKVEDLIPDSQAARYVD